MLNPKLVEAIQSEIAQARDDELEEDDVLCMAVGAGIRVARETGALGDEAISPELDAAIKTVVKQEMK